MLRALCFALQLCLAVSIDQNTKFISIEDAAAHPNQNIRRGDCCLRAAKLETELKAAKAEIKRLQEKRAPAMQSVNQSSFCKPEVSNNKRWRAVRGTLSVSQPNLGGADRGNYKGAYRTCACCTAHTNTTPRHTRHTPARMFTLHRACTLLKVVVA